MFTELGIKRIYLYRCTDSTDCILLNIAMSVPNVCYYNSMLVSQSNATQIQIFLSILHLECK